MTAALVLLGLTGAVLDVAGDGDCPQSTEVATRLEELLVVRPARALEARALVERDGNLLSIRLESKDGQIIGVRTLTAQGSCEALASAAAVVLAAWLGDTYPSILGLPAVGTEPSDRAPALTPVPPVPAKAQRAARPSRGSPRAERGFERIPEAAPTFKLGSSAALGASVTSAGAAPVAAFGVSILRTAPSFGWWLGLTIAGARETPLGAGVVRFSRWPVMTGPFLRLSGERIRADVSAGAAVGLLTVEGQGFTRDSRAQDVTYGPFASLRVSGSGQRLEPFLGVATLFWAKQATAYVQSPVRSELGLPDLELWVLAGVIVEP